jgi:hypothetical protein
MGDKVPDDIDRLNALINAAAAVAPDCDVSAIVAADVDAALAAAAFLDRLLWGVPGDPGLPGYPGGIMPCGLLSAPTKAERKRDAMERSLGIACAKALGLRHGR